MASFYILRHSKGTQTDIQINRDGHIYYDRELHKSNCDSGYFSSNDSTPPPVHTASTNLSLKESDILPIHKKEDDMELFNAIERYLLQLPGGWDDNVEMLSSINQHNDNDKSPQPSRQPSVQTCGNGCPCLADAELQRKIHYIFDHIEKLIQLHPRLFQDISLDRMLNFFGTECTEERKESSFPTETCYNSDTSAYFTDAEATDTEMP